MDDGGLDFDVRHDCPDDEYDRHVATVSCQEVGVREALANTELICLAPAMAEAIQYAATQHRDGNAVCVAEHSRPCVVCDTAAKLRALSRPAEEATP
jgi:hypothetical protein